MNQGAGMKVEMDGKMKMTVGVTGKILIWHQQKKGKQHESKKEEDKKMWFFFLCRQ